MALWVVALWCAGCASSSGLSLRTLDTNVGWKMTAFQTAEPLGGIPANQAQQIRVAHESYQKSFQQAVAAAGGNLNAAAPPAVVNQANELIDLIANALGNP